MNIKNDKLALLLVRFAAAGNMLIHGITRLSLGTVSNFDGYLSSIGFPPYTAWVLTIFELAGAVIYHPRKMGHSHCPYILPGVTHGNYFSPLP
jgi:hypothetical protein